MCCAVDLPFFAPFPVLASFSMLCTIQFRLHFVLSLVRPRRHKRVMRLLCRLPGNTGFTVLMR